MRAVHTANVLEQKYVVIWEEQRTLHSRVFLTEQNALAFARRLEGVASTIAVRKVGETIERERDPVQDALACALRDALIDALHDVSWSSLADELVVALAGKVVFVEKEAYDILAADAALWDRLGAGGNRG
jgi:hypothetical protein